MKTLFTTLIAIGMVAFGSAANAAVINISPDEINGSACSADGSPDGFYCWNGGVNAEANDAFNAVEIAAETGYAGTGVNALSLLYKAEVGDVDSPDTTYAGTYLDRYTTTFSNTELDPANAVVTSLDGAVDICDVCYLYVKDGNNDPNWYIFQVNWDGTSDIVLTDFWLANGGISHVSVFGVDTGDRGLTCEDTGGCPVVPIPPAVWLFGSGLIGLVGVARRKA